MLFICIFSIVLPKNETANVSTNLSKIYTLLVCSVIRLGVDPRFVQWVRITTISSFLDLLWTSKVLDLSLLSFWCVLIIRNQYSSIKIKLQQFQWHKNKKNCILSLTTQTFKFKLKFNLLNEKKNTVFF